MTTSAQPSLGGRRAQAARNDELILAAAREVFIADPSAPIATVAERAGVGISALYRRYPSKEELLRRLCADGLERYIEIGEAALAREGEPREAFLEFVTGVVDADTVSLVERLAGTFVPTQELYARSEHAHAIGVRIVERAKDAGVLRRDVEADDVNLVFEQLASLRIGRPERTAELRRRYLRLALDALRQTSAEDLPGAPPRPGELGERWVPSA